MEMKAKIFVLGVKGYNFTQEDGKVITGAKVTYVAQETDDGASKGFLPLQDTIDLEYAKQIKDSLPGIFEASYDMVPGRNNKPTLAISSLSPVKKVDVNKIING